MSSLPMRAEDGAWLVLSLAFAFGACIGSFLNVCIHRLPQDESVLRPASRCPRCAAPIAWRDNIPLLSWLVLGAAFLPRGVGPLDALAGAVLGGGILWAVAWSYEHLTGVEGMGFGDVK